MIKREERRVVTGGENPKGTVTTECQPCDKLEALVLLGRRLGTL